MATCATSAQCRSGYACVDLSGDDPWSAEIIEEDPESTSVCMEAQSVPEFEEGRSDAFCSLEDSAGNGSASEDSVGAAGAPGD